MLDTFKRNSEPVGRKRLHCNYCQRNTIHSLEAQCEGSWADDPVGGGYQYSIFRCGACDTVCYETTTWDDQDVDYDEDGEPYTVLHFSQYPAPTSASFAFNTEYTPSDLDVLIGEMMYAFAGTKLTLATVGLRMVIEFIVNHAKCPGKTLMNKIDALHEQGHVDDQQKALLHKIRKRGNAGAHELSPMDTKELVAGMGVVELLLEKLYNGPGRRKTLLQRAESVFRDDPEGVTDKG